MPRHPCPGLGSVSCPSRFGHSYLTTSIPPDLTYSYFVICAALRAATSQGGSGTLFHDPRRGGVTQKSLKKFTFFCDGRAGPLIQRGCTLHHIPACSLVHFPTLCHFPSLCAHSFSMYCCPLLPSLANAP